MSGGSVANARATAACKRETILDPSASLSVTAEHVPSSGHTWLTFDARQGLDQAVRFTVRADEVYRVLADVMALVRGDRT